MLGRMPVDLSFPYSTTCGTLQMMVVLSEMSESWKDLLALEEKIHSHKEYGERQRDSIEQALEAQQCSAELTNAILHLYQANEHIFHNGVKGCALFFAGECY
jgi:hypothetical protein